MCHKCSKQNGITKAYLQKLLCEYSKINKIKLITVYLFDHKSNINESLVYICQLKECLPKYSLKASKNLDDFYFIKSLFNPNDFQLPDNTVSVFR